MAGSSAMSSEVSFMETFLGIVVVWLSCLRSGHDRQEKGTCLASLIRVTVGAIRWQTNGHQPVRTRVGFAFITLTSLHFTAGNR